jgi:hypothetical protein
MDDSDLASGCGRAAILVSEFSKSERVSADVQEAG